MLCYLVDGLEILYSNTLVGHGQLMVVKHAGPSLIAVSSIIEAPAIIMGYCAGGWQWYSARHLAAVAVRCDTRCAWW